MLKRASIIFNFPVRCARLVPRSRAGLRPLLDVISGCMALALGLLVYMADRPISHAVLMPDLAPFTGRHLFGTVGLWLPSAVHPLAFSLFTAAVLKPTAAARFGVCAFWCVVNIGFEVGQHPAFSPWWAAALNAGAGDYLGTQSVLNYFLRGTFDPRDICAALFGALVAGAFLHFVDHALETRHAPN